MSQTDRAELRLDRWLGRAATPLVSLEVDRLLNLSPTHVVSRIPYSISFEGIILQVHQVGFAYY